MTSNRNSPLNDAQLRTLRWIADGCPDGVMRDATYKVSAIALQHRGLVRVRRGHRLWSATITEAGSAYLEAFPPDQSTARKRRPTEALIAALLEHDGRLEIPYAEADRYEQLARAARRSKLLPAGKRILVERRWKDEKAWVYFEDLPAWKTATLAPIPVPAALHHPSAVVTALRGREDFRIRRAEQSRALRLVEALVQEATRRGYTVQPTSPPDRDRWGYAIHERGQGHFTIALGADAYRLSVRQLNERVPHVPTKEELARAERGWPPPKYDTVLSARLRITIEGNDAPFWDSSWSDTPTRPLEECLAQILQELELRHERAGQRRHDEVRQREERQRRWEAARANAIDHLTQAHRAAALQEQVQRWELAHWVRAYVAAMEACLEGCADPQERQGAEAWIGWARDYAQRIDPLNAPLGMPDDPKPTEEALQPFMKGWDPYGP